MCVYHSSDEVLKNCEINMLLFWLDLSVIRMEVRAEMRLPEDLTEKKDLPVSTDKEAGWAYDRSGILQKR